MVCTAPKYVYLYSDWVNYLSEMLEKTELTGPKTMQGCQSIFSLLQALADKILNLSLTKTVYIGKPPE